MAIPPIKMYLLVLLTICHTVEAILIPAESKFHILPQIAKQRLTTSTNDEKALQLLNSYRRRHGVLPLEYDVVLAQNAAKWGKKVHDKLILMNKRVALYSHPHIEGENVFVAVGSDGEKGSTAVRKWYSEMKDYDFVSNTFDFRTAQFTQLIWKRTRRLGISTIFDPVRNFTVTVARFKPPGNVGFHLSFKENIFPPFKIGTDDIPITKVSIRNQTKQTPIVNSIKPEAKVAFNITHKLKNTTEKFASEFKRSISRNLTDLGNNNPLAKDKHVNLNETNQTALTQIVFLTGSKQTNVVQNPVLNNIINGSQFHRFLDNNDTVAGFGNQTNIHSNVTFSTSSPPLPTQSNVPMILHKTKDDKPQNAYQLSVANQIGIGNGLEAVNSTESKSKGSIN